MENIKYSSNEILEYYKDNRSNWDSLYPSEQYVLKRILRDGGVGDVLDVGCACGGLGLALDEKCIESGIRSYTGVDIHEDSIKMAKEKVKLSVPSEFIAADIMKLQLSEKFDLVLSLSCADWNLRTNEILNTCWDLVKPGGCFLVSLRLTDKPSVNDIKQSFQIINFSGKSGEDSEKANYVVFNFREIMRIFLDMTPKPLTVGGYGYWGSPSETASCPYERLAFTVFYIRKPFPHEKSEGRVELQLPLELFV
ncbi:MAG: class I SAM-dependent methyltransferase [Magnetococcales bacterium]|nr:class I SAM-dependent methyltransferase [Magnetococcales bacterium]